jgi:arylformamidase
VRLIDVSVPTKPGFPGWPGTHKYKVHRLRETFSGGKEAIASTIEMSVHFGTHIDAPRHFNKDGVTIDEIDLALLVGSCRLYEYVGDKHIGADDLAAMGLKAGPRVLIKTANSQIVGSASEFQKDYIAFLPDAITYLVDKGVKLLGFDYFGIGAYGEVSNQNHIAFQGAGGVIIENLDLSAVGPGEYFLMALPVKMVGLEAAPARVLLGVED